VAAVLVGRVAAEVVMEWLEMRWSGPAEAGLRE